MPPTLLEGTSELFGSVTETGIFSQWFHDPRQLYYARWAEGEVDIVYLDNTQRPQWAVEVKWSDRFVDHPGELTGLLKFCETNQLSHAVVTTRTQTATRTLVPYNLEVNFIPASLYCYTIGHRLIAAKTTHINALPVKRVRPALE